MNVILSKSKRSFLLVALFLMGCLQLLAQSRMIQGEVTDAQNGEPLIGATVGDDVDDKRVCYGSAPNSQFSLYKEEDDSNRQGWDIWFNDDAKSMESATITVDLNTMTWKYE